MTASAEHIKALVRSHATGDDAGFYAIALQVAAKAARQGHGRLASDLKETIDASRREPTAAQVTSTAQPRGELVGRVGLPGGLRAESLSLLGVGPPRHPVGRERAF